MTNHFYEAAGTYEVFHYQADVHDRYTQHMTADEAWSAKELHSIQAVDAYVGTFFICDHINPLPALVVYVRSLFTAFLIVEKLLWLALLSLLLPAR